ncbi:MAG: DUF2339 domain-containing protein [Ignavibacteriales bacterium]|nr:DUF2339 domain-containing protein [Ignavibacteriales bacterium]
MAIALLVIILLALLVGLFVKIFSFSERLNQIEFDLRKVKQLGNLLDSLQREVEILKSRSWQDKQELRGLVKIPAEPAEKPATVAPQPQAKEAAVPPVPARNVTPQFAEEPPRPSRTREEWEAFVGGKLLNRIGALALIIGIGLFLKHAFDENWISETVRVLIGVFAGALCLAAAYRTHSKGLKIFAQGLAGTGIAVLYLSVYASFSFYALVPQVVAFLLMALVTTLAISVGFYYDSLAAALLGLFGGFLTPIMLSTGHSNEIGLFTYLALLNVGLLGLLLKKESWAILEPLSFVGTWLLYAAWHVRYYQPEDLFLTIFFISLFWLLYYALDVYRALRARPGHLPLHHVIAGTNAMVFYITLYVLLDKQYHEWMGLATLLVGAVYFGTILIAMRRTGLPPITKARYLLGSMALLVIATAIQFHDFRTVIVWSIEAVILIWCGWHWRIRYVWQAAAWFFGVVVVKLLATDGSLQFAPIRQFTLFFSERTLTFAVVTASLAIGAWLTTILRWSETDETADWTKDALQFAWCAMLFALLTIETNDYFRLQSLDQQSVVLDMIGYTRLMTLPVVWILCSAFVLGLGIRTEAPTVVIASLGFLALAVIVDAAGGMSYEPIRAFTALFNKRAASMLIVLIVMVIQAKMMLAHPENWDWLHTTRGILQVTIVVFLLLFFTAETRDYFENRMAELSLSFPDNDISTPLDHLHNLQQLSLSGVWLLYSVALMAYGIWRSVRNVRIVAFVLFGITILKIFVYDLSFLETTYRICSFIGLGLILLAVSYVYQRYRELIFGTPEPQERSFSS